MAYLGFTQSLYNIEGIKFCFHLTLFNIPPMSNYCYNYMCQPVCVCAW